MMTKQDLLIRLKELQGYSDLEDAHIHADSALLEYIGDDEITKAFRDIEKWYA
jgi:hypothetical protein